MTKTKRNDPCPCGSGRKFKLCHGTMAGPNSGHEKQHPYRLSAPYSELPEIAAVRRKEIASVFQNELTFIDDCLALTATLVEVLGDVPPVDVRDSSIRDLACDAFEFLFAGKEALLENKPMLAFPLMRRAFESTCLSQVFVQNQGFAEKWAKGKQIPNGEVRKQMEKEPLADSGDEIRETYRYFSGGAHPNRTHVPFLFLGEGNQFTLGSIPPVDELNLGGHFRYLMQMAYWLIGVLAFHYHKPARKLGNDFARAILDLTPRIRVLGFQLERQLDEMRKRLCAEGVPEGIGPKELKR